jgi:glyoxylase-like metal-dependent hydrolase (beta-lactamase superfamily II)
LWTLHRSAISASLRGEKVIGGSDEDSITVATAAAADCKRFGSKPMVEKILPNFYKIEIPLPGSPLKALNSYVIKAPERNLIIDTGWDQEESRNAMQSGLRELGLDLENCDFFITHRHTDHLGLVSHLRKRASKVYFNQPDADSVKKSTVRWNDSFKYARANGLPERELQKVLDRHPGYKYRTRGRLAFTILRGGDPLNIGEYSFKCMETPGHTEGHMCLYEPRKKVFISGDHILNDITPNIQLWSDRWNPLEEYLKSLDKVYELDIEYLLTGHREIFGNCRQRIVELKEHHRKRIDEILSILKDGSKNAFQVASEMSWDVVDVYDSFDLFPATQKWFATGEAIAHLKYIEEKGMIQRKMLKHEIVYSLN